jgi:fumarylacetoacetate (FAA) hydrolase
MKFGDTIRIEMKGSDGLSIFGAIDQDVVSSTAEPAS